MVELQKKINFLYHVLYNESLNELTKAFIPNNYPTLKEIRSRKVTVKKWLSESVKSVNKFYSDYYDYPVSKFYFENSEEVFPLIAFTEWSIDDFEMRYYEYQDEQNKDIKDRNYKVPLENYSYIYYYLEGNTNLAYFKIEYFDNDKVEFKTTHHTQIITYTGEITRHSESSTLHYIVENNLEMMFFSFNKLDLKLKNYAYGIGLSKDFQLKNPKASYVILSKEKLSEEEERLFQTKINPTNILVADNKKQFQDESFIENLSTHICSLAKLSTTYPNNDIFLNLFLEELRRFNKKFYNFQNKFEFKLTSFSSSMQVILNLLDQSQTKHHVKVLYTLESIDESLFSSIDELGISLYNFIIEKSISEKVSFDFIVALKHKIVINENLKNKFKKLEEAGVSLRFRTYRDIFSYSTLILVDNNKLAISCIKGEDEFNVTRSSSTISKLKNEYNKQRNYAKFLHTILEKNYLLNGTYYMYSYGSNNNFDIEELTIDGNRIEGVLSNHYNPNRQGNIHKYQGSIHRIYGNILFCTEYGIIKFKKEDERNIIKIVSLTSDQENGNRQPIILFAILSRIKIEEEDIDAIFSAMIDKKDSSYEKASFKISLSFHEILRPLLFKYEKIEREELN